MFIKGIENTPEKYTKQIKTDSIMNSIELAKPLIEFLYGNKEYQGIKETC